MLYDFFPSALVDRVTHNNVRFLSIFPSFDGWSTQRYMAVVLLFSRGVNKLLGHHGYQKYLLHL